LAHFLEAQKYSIHPDIVFAIKTDLPTIGDLEQYIQTECTNEFPRGDWEEVKDRLMFDACLNRFKQHPVLANMLLSTGDRPILLLNQEDLYWGIGMHGNGTNAYGELLMKIRAMTDEEVRNSVQLLLT
jgi:ribA/ribD-fused uncharacterized protein